MDTPKNANKFMFFLLLYIFAVPFAFIPLIKGITGTDEITPIMYGIYSIVSFAIPTAAYVLYSKIPLTNLIPIKKIKLKNVVLITMISISVQPILTLFSAVSNLFFENDVAQVLMEYRKHSYLTMMFSMAVIPAVCEEIVFRGIILTGYKKAGIEKAALATGLFFAIIHLNAQQFMYAAFMGVLFAYFVYYTNSIFSSVLSHFIINGCQITASYLNNYFYPERMAENITMTFNEKMMMIQESAYTALIFIPVLVGLLVLFIMINKKLKLDLIHQIMQHSRLIIINPEPEYDIRICTLFFWLTVALFIAIMLLTL